jgi:two-component system, cell cycle response regulator DivK
MAKTILVVEDNALNRKLMVEVLRHHGYEVIEAINGAQALLIIRRQVIDLVIMDMQMPIMNGYETVQVLRADAVTAGIKIIAVTSFALAEERERIIATGVDVFVSKPIDTRKFPKLVAQLFNNNEPFEDGRKT